MGERKPYYCNLYLACQEVLDEDRLRPFVADVRACPDESPLALLLAHFPELVAVQRQMAEATELPSCQLADSGD
ncbi:MAG: hypothetical protein ACYC1C_13395 [Chloroflexota bacterium]